MEPRMTTTARLTPIARPRTTLARRCAGVGAVPIGVGIDMRTGAPIGVAIGMPAVAPRGVPIGVGIVWLPTETRSALAGGARRAFGTVGGSWTTGGSCTVVRRGPIPERVFAGGS
jgi:hypothetical protein